MNKPNHSACTIDALNTFKSMQEISISNKDIAALLSRFSEKEDGGIQRPFHWHFFNNRDQIGNSIIPGERTSETRVAALIKLLDQSLQKYKKDLKTRDAKDILKYSARLIHHIQDMGAPSHVVPVYHGSTLSVSMLKDAYEVFCESLSSVQRTFLVETLSSAPAEGASIELTRKEFDTYKDQVKNANANEDADSHLFHSLYTFSAHWTLDHLRNNTFTLRENGLETVKNWTAFWEENAVNKSSSHQGFGNFGPLGNNFGKSSFTIGRTLWEADDSQYLLLVRDMYKRMVLGTLFVLEYINKESSIFGEKRELIVSGEGD